MSCQKLSGRKVKLDPSASTSKTSINLPPKNIIPINKMPRKVLVNKDLNVAEEVEVTEQNQAFMMTPEQFQTWQNVKFITPMNVNNFVSTKQSVKLNDNEVFEEDSTKEPEETEHSEIPIINHNEIETNMECENDECYHCRNYFQLIIRNQNKILELLRNQKTSSHEENNYLPELPCNSITNLISFEKLLRDKRACRRQLEHCIENLGGNNLQKSVNNAMYYVMTNEVARRCTWTGVTENSYKIKGTLIAKIICKVFVAQKQGTVVEVDGRIALWLRRVGDRLKAEKKSIENAAKKIVQQNELEDDS